MQIALKDGRRYILVFNMGEDFLSEFKKFLNDQNIHSGFFTAVGAASHIQLGSYSLETKSYELKEWSGQFEITNLTGNISKSGDELVVHTHGTFSDEHFKAFGGHVFVIKVSAALELHLIHTDGIIERVQDELIGLKLLHGNGNN